MRRATRRGGDGVGAGGNPVGRRVALAALAAGALAACARSRPDVGPDGRVRLVFKHQALPGDPAPFARWVAAFAAANPDVDLSVELLPSASEMLHQYFLTSLEAGRAELDVFVADVVWVAEFARAGWIADLSSAFPPARLRRDFLPGAAEACLPGGSTRAVPWFADVGMLYFRSDLVPEAPRTWDELIDRARAIGRASPGVRGFLFQGRQYEGLVCNAYETMWGWGATTFEGDRVVVDDPDAVAAMELLRALVAEGVAPASTTTMDEERARRLFQAGGAAFMRNWPYAWGELQREGSPVRGRVGFGPLPSRDGHAPHGALGGWQLAVRASASPRQRAAAERLVAHLTSREGNLVLALGHGLVPARRDALEAPALRSGAPFTAALLPFLEEARPRPLTASYLAISDVLQGELSAIVAGVRPAREALGRAQALLDHLAADGAG